MTVSPSSQDTLADAVRGLGIPRGARLLLAVSGGPDSVALLHVVTRLAPDQEWSLRIGHINHRLRHEDSDADERFVRHLAEKYGVAIDVERVDVAELARRTRQSIEAAARDARYRALSNWLRRWPGDVILTGHTLDDQAETVLLRLFRGAGTVGLGGMPSDGTILRPFLPVDRAAIHRALDEWGLAFREDASNRDPRFRRNALRLTVMPAVLALAPSAPRLIARAAEHLRLDADYILAEARRAIASMDPRTEAGGISASRTTWQVLHPALRRHTLRILVGEVVGSLDDVETRHIIDLENALLRGASITGRLPHDLQMHCLGMRFVIAAGETPQEPPSPAPLQIPGTAPFGSWDISATEIAGHDTAAARILAVRGPWHALLDAKAVGAGLTVRTRRPGDRIQPAGMHGSRKLQDILVDRKIAVRDRDRLPLVTCGEDIVWIPGTVIDRRYAATSATERLLHLSVKPREGRP